MKIINLTAIILCSIAAGVSLAQGDIAWCILEMLLCFINMLFVLPSLLDD